MKNAILLITAALLLVGCESTPKNAHPRLYAEKTKVEKDPFQKSVTITSPQFDYSIKTPQGFGLFFYHFMATRYPDQPTHYYLQFMSMRSLRDGWAFWKEAWDLQQTKMPFLTSNQQIQTRWLHESATIALSREQVDKLKTSPTTWRIYGTRANIDLPINPNLANGFLLKCDETLGPN